MVSIERIASRVPPVERADFFRRFFVKALLLRKPFAPRTTTCRQRRHPVCRRYRNQTSTRSFQPPASSMRASPETAVNVPSPLLRYRLLRAEIVGHIKIGQAVGSRSRPRRKRNYSGRSRHSILPPRSCLQTSRSLRCAAENSVDHCGHRNRAPDSDTGPAPGSSCTGRSKHRDARHDRSRLQPHG